MTRLDRTGSFEGTLSYQGCWLHKDRVPVIDFQCVTEDDEDITWSLWCGHQDGGDKERKCQHMAAKKLRIMGCDGETMHDIFYDAATVRAVPCEFVVVRNGKYLNADVTSINGEPLGGRVYRKPSDVFGGTSDKPPAPSNDDAPLVDHGDDEPDDTPPESPREPPPELPTDSDDNLPF